jgi:hypothetical protein
VRAAPEWFLDPAAESRVTPYDGNVEEWLDEHDGDLDAGMREIVDSIPSGDFGHEEMCKLQNTIVTRSALGHTGGAKALEILKSEFLRPPYNDSGHAKEFAEALRTEIAKRGASTAISTILITPELRARMAARKAARKVLAQVSTDGETDPREEAILAEVTRIEIRDEAQRRAREARAVRVPIPLVVRLSDFLAVEDEPAEYAVDGILPVGGNALLAGPAKAGKSTFIGNLIGAIADGETFLDRFATGEPRNVTLIDDELDERMLRRWLREHDIRNTDKVHVVSLRGRMSSFNVLDDTVRANWVRTLPPTDLLVFDCLRPALDALGLDENLEAGQFLIALDALKAEAGISEMVVVHHTGHEGERSRGSTRIIDWPDVLWNIKRSDNRDLTSERFFTAFGRDVNLPEGRLEFDQEARALKYLDGDRKGGNATKALAAILNVLAASSEPMSGYAIEQWNAAAGVDKLPRADIRDALTRGALEGRLETSPGPRNATLYSLSKIERKFGEHHNISE